MRRTGVAAASAVAENFILANAKNDRQLITVGMTSLSAESIRHRRKDDRGIACPQMLYPYLRAIVSDVCTRAGFPPVLLSEVNFQAMFEAQQAQAQGNAGNGSGLIASA